MHLFGHLGGAGAQLPGTSDVSQHKGKRAKGTRTGAETHCGGVCAQAVQAVLQGQCHAALAVVRPPGHHAECARAMGFCFYNNCAVAAREALRHPGASVRGVRSRGLGKGRSERYCSIRVRQCVVWGRVVWGRGGQGGAAAPGMRARHGGRVRETATASTGRLWQTIHCAPLRLCCVAAVVAGVERVLVLDWDVHYGNGIAEVRAMHSPGLGLAACSAGSAARCEPALAATSPPSPSPRGVAPQCEQRANATAGQVLRRACTTCFGAGPTAPRRSCRCCGTTRGCCTSPSTATQSPSTPSPQARSCAGLSGQLSGPHLTTQSPVRALDARTEVAGRSPAVCTAPAAAQRAASLRPRRGVPPTRLRRRSGAAC